MQEYTWRKNEYMLLSIHKVTGYFTGHEERKDGKGGEHEKKQNWFFLPVWQLQSAWQDVRKKK